MNWILIFALTPAVERVQEFSVEVQGVGTISGEQKVYSSPEKVVVWRRVSFDGDNPLFERYYSGNRVYVFSAKSDSVIIINLGDSTYSVQPLGTNVVPREILKSVDASVDSHIEARSDTCYSIRSYRQVDKRTDSTAMHVCFGKFESAGLERQSLNWLADLLGIDRGMVEVFLALMGTPAAGFAGMDEKVLKLFEENGVPVYMEGESFIAGEPVLQFDIRTVSMKKTDAVPIPDLSALRRK